MPGLCIYQGLGESSSLVYREGWDSTLWWAVAVTRQGLNTRGHRILGRFKNRFWYNKKNEEIETEQLSELE